MLDRRIIHILALLPPALGAAVTLVAVFVGVAWGLDTSPLLSGFMAFVAGLLMAWLWMALLSLVGLVVQPSVRGLITAVAVSALVFAAVTQLRAQALLQVGFVGWFVAVLDSIICTISRAGPKGPQTSSRTPPPASGPT